MTVINKLEECPFCGEKAEYYEQDASIWCNNCPGGVEDCTISKEELFAAWNRRNLGNQVKELESKKIGVKERDVLIQKDPPKFIKEVIIRYDPSTNKGRGIDQIINGLGRIIE